MHSGGCWQVPFANFPGTVGANSIPPENERREQVSFQCQLEEGRIRQYPVSLNNYAFTMYR